MARREVVGYVDMGHIRIPALPKYIVMTDRDTGLQWALSHSEDGESFIITDSLPPAKELGNTLIYYNAYEGPWVQGDPTLRLFIRDRHLGYEIVPMVHGVTGRNQRPINTRRSYQTFTREVVKPDGWSPNHGLQHNGFDFTP